MEHQGGAYGGATGVFSYEISTHNNLNIPPPPPPAPAVYNNNPISTPPLSAINRFLATDLEINGNRVYRNNNMILNPNYLEVPFDSNNFFYENRHPGLNNSSPREGTYNFFMTQSQIQNWENSVGVYRNEEMRTSDQLGRQKKRRARGGYSSNIIKGQWTAEEDRKLLSLVHEHGDRKWAQIAVEMFGRAGKQCRERWQNHLRPNIKKDSWSEEEEKMLIEAHQRLGNKWAEIAKRIPGRSENSIKNHWNATKRRQFSKRKIKKANEASKNSILHDYIKAKILKAANQSSPNSTSTQANSNSDNPSSNHEIPTFPQSTSEDSTSLIGPTYDEELDNFMQSLFGSNDSNKPPSADDIGKLFNDGNVFSPSSSIEHGTMMITDNQENMQNHENVARMQPMDAYKVSVMLDGVYSTPYLDYCYDDTPCLDKVHQQQQQQLVNHHAQASSTSGTKEMDLFEMVLANFRYSQ